MFCHGDFNMTKKKEYRPYCTSFNKGGIQCFHWEGHKGKHEGMIVINGQGMATAFWYDDEKEDLG